MKRKKKKVDKSRDQAMRDMKRKEAIDKIQQHNTAVALLGEDGLIFSIPDYLLSNKISTEETHEVIN